MISRDITIRLYQSLQDDNERRVYDQWHASSISDCLRAHYFKRLGVPPLNLPSGAKIIRWSAGHAIEGVIRPQLKKMFPDLQSNVRLTSKRLSLTGEYDNYSPKAKAIIEIKSIHDYAFKEKDGVTALKKQDGNHKNGNKKWELKEDPYLNHELQNHAYKILLEENDLSVERIIYVYVSLSGRIAAYDTSPNKNLSENVMGRLSSLNRAWRNKTPPDCVCQPDHPLYDEVLQWCDYREDGRCCDLSSLNNVPIIKGENNE